MKKLLYLTVAIAMLSMGACKKDKSTKAENRLSATVDGNDYLGSTVQVKTYQPNTGYGDHLMMAIGAADAAKTNIFALAITFTNDKLSTGTYQCDVDSDDGVVYTQGNTVFLTGASDNATGTITITKIDDHYVEGTFSATMENAADETEVKSVTNGKFSISY